MIADELRLAVCYPGSTGILGVPWESAPFLLRSRVRVEFGRTQGLAVRHRHLDDLVSCYADDHPELQQNS